MRRLELDIVGVESSGACGSGTCPSLGLRSRLVFAAHKGVERPITPPGFVEGTDERRSTRKRVAAVGSPQTPSATDRTMRRRQVVCARSHHPDLSGDSDAPVPSSVTFAATTPGTARLATLAA